MNNVEHFPKDRRGATNSVKSCQKEKSKHVQYMYMCQLVSKQVQQLTKH